MTVARVASAVSAALLLVVMLLSAAAAAVLESVATPWDAFDVSSGPDERRLPDAEVEIPVRMNLLYRQAAATCPGLSWTVLAAIGKVASDHGRRLGEQGVMGLSRERFDRYSLPVPGGGASPPSAADPIDAVFAAARVICSSGPAAGVRSMVGSVTDDPAAAVRIVELADLYARAPVAGSSIAAAAATAPSSAARLAVEYAGAQLGLPYVWGGNGPDRGGGIGFDCSGLTQSTYQAAGVTIPRTATEQFHIGRPVGVQDLRAGDLVFFGDPNGFIHHVGIYLSGGLMIDAPHPGAVVRTDPIAAADYAGARRES